MRHLLKTKLLILKLKKTKGSVVEEKTPDS